MAAIPAPQTFIASEDSLQYPAVRVVQQAGDGDLDLAGVLAGRPIATATSTAVVAADTVVFAFTGLTLAGLNLAAGESRTLKARVRSSGAAVTACTFAIYYGLYMNVAGTLTIAPVAASPAPSPSVAGVLTITVGTWAVANSAVQLTVTAPATVTTSTYTCELFFEGPKGS